MSEVEVTATVLVGMVYRFADIAQPHWAVIPEFNWLDLTRALSLHHHPVLGKAVRAYTCMKGHVIAQPQLFRLTSWALHTHCVNLSERFTVGQHSMCSDKTCFLARRCLPMSRTTKALNNGTTSSQNPASPARNLVVCKQSERWGSFLKEHSALSHH